jgi:hypothetical protein
VIGTGADGALPVMQQVRDEARRRKIDLVILPTAEAIGALAKATAAVVANARLRIWMQFWLQCGSPRWLGASRRAKASG